jgi:outer membrane phospholipase A
MAQKARLQQLSELDEKHLDAIHQTIVIQQQRTKWHDRVIKKKLFQKGDWALLYDSRIKEFQGKLCTRWLGPYEVDTIFPNGTVRLITFDGSNTHLHANGHRLRLYQHPLSKTEFKTSYTADTDYQILNGKEHAPSPSEL